MLSGLAEYLEHQVVHPLIWSFLERYQRPSVDLLNKFKKHTHNKEIKNKGVHITVFQYPVVGFLMICHKHFQMQNYKLIQHKQDDNKIQTKCFIYFKESVLWLF